MKIDGLTNDCLPFEKLKTNLTSASFLNQYLTEYDR